jgi:hypothetical protein
MGLLGKAMNINAMFSANSLGNMPIPDIPIPGNYVIPPVNGVRICQGHGFHRALQQMFSDIGSKRYAEHIRCCRLFQLHGCWHGFHDCYDTTMFSGMSIVWDRRLGFLDKVLSTPVSRAAIIFSKVLNATLRAMFQATIILALAYLLGLK